MCLRWLAVRRPSNPAEQRLFLNARGKPLTRFGIRYLLKKLGTRAQDQCPSIQTKTLTPHVLRHTTAMHLIRAGNDLSSIAYWLGHAHLKTTHLYVEIDMEAKRRMLDKTQPPRPAPSVWYVWYQKDRHRSAFRGADFFRAGCVHCGQRVKPLPGLRELNAGLAAKAGYPTAYVATSIYDFGDEHDRPSSRPPGSPPMAASPSPSRTQASGDCRSPISLAPKTTASAQEHAYRSHS